MLLETLLTPLLLLVGSALGDDEIVKEFKKYFKKYKDAATRVEAIYALEGTESTGVVKVLLPVTVRCKRCRWPISIPLQVAH